MKLVGSNAIGLAKLVDGKNQYFYIRYSKNENGLGMTEKPQSDTLFIGILVSQIPTPSENPGDYTWTKFIGVDGVDGSDGANGRDGVAGKDGVGLSSTKVEYARSLSGTTIPTTGWKVSIPNTSPGEYMWTKTTWTYTDGDTEIGYSVSRIGIDGNTGEDGVPGKDGVGLKDTLIQYAGSTSGTSAPTTGWGSSVPTVPSGNYLWTKTTWTYTDDTNEVGYSVARMGINGKDGTDGIAGKDGVGLKDTVIEYAQSSSGTVKPTLDWSTNIPSVPSGNYLWTRTTWTYTDNTTETGYTVSRIGKDGNTGKDGIAGKDGVGISSTKVEYVGSTSGTTKPTSGWTLTIPSVAAGNFLWTKTTWTYTDGTSETGYSVAKMGETGLDGESSYTWVRYSPNADGSNMTAEPTPTSKYIGVAITSDNNPPTDYKLYSWALIKGADGRGVKSTDISYQVSASGTTTPTGTWSTTVPAVPKGKYLWTRILITYTDNTNTASYSISYQGVDGLANIMGFLTNESITLPANSSGSVLTYGGAEGVFEVYEGTNRKTGASVAYSILSKTNMEISISTDGSYKVSSVSTGSSIRNAYATLRASYGGITIDKQLNLSKAFTGAQGNNGKDGVAGKDGVGISDTIIMYAQSTNGTTAPSAGWTENIPTVPSGSYLWTQTTWKYTDGTNEVGYTVSRIGKDGNTGKDGIAGKDGVGLQSTKVEYAHSTSGTTAPTTGWTLTVPTVPNGSFLWTRTIWTYTDKTTETGYSVSRIGNDGNDGIAGKDGVGVKSTAITYSQSTSGTTAPTSGWSTSVPTLVKGQYLWTKTTWTYTDNSTEIGYTVSYNAKDGNTGKDGIAGKDGVGISNTLIQYVGSTSGTTKPTSGWSTTIPTVAEGSFLWTKTTWTYTDNSTEIGYSVAKMGAKGDKGATGASGKDGVAGKDGKGIKSTVIAYATSTNGTTQPASGWNPAVPSLTKGQYLWTRTIWTYTDNTTETGYSVSYIAKDGNTGKDGIAGKDGVGIKSTAITYAGSTSGTVKPTSGWTTAVPTVASGSFLWTRTIWTYTDNTTETGYSVARMGSNGANGATGAPGASATSYWITASNNIIGKSQTGVINPTTITFKGFSKTGTANSVAYSGRFIIQTSTNGTSYTTRYTSSANQSSYTYTIPADSLFVKCKFYQAGGTTILLDEQTVPIVESAEGLVGGATNLLKNTNKDWKVANFPISAFNYNIQGLYNLSDYGLSGGDEVTLSIELQGTSESTAMRARFEVFNSGADRKSFVGEAVENGLSFVKAKIPQGYQKFRVMLQPNPSPTTKAFSINYRKEMLTKGNLLVDWQPAPEDARTYPAWSNSADGKVDFTKVKPNENLVVRSGELENKMVGLDGHVGPLTNSSVMEEPITVIAGESITFTKTTATAGDNYWRYKYINTNGALISRYANAENLFTQVVPVGATGIVVSYTTGAKVKLERGTTSTIYTTNPQDSLTGSVPQYIGFSPLDSDKPEDYAWMVNPEWAEKKAEEDSDSVREWASSEITQTSESIMQSVQSNYVSIDELGEYRESVSTEFEQTAKDFNFIFNEIRESVENVGSDTETKFQEISKYIRFEDGDIVLGASNSDSSLRISMDEMAFIQGGNKVAYFSGQSFYIDKGIIVEKLQVGQHAMVKGANGHTSFEYTG